MIKTTSRYFPVAGIALVASGINWGYQNNAFSRGQEKPNFIIIMTDDQGYNDLGCYGSEAIKTPRIDRMAEEGTRFTCFYAQPVCGPSRGALMTGRYPVRIGGGWVVNAEEIFIPEILRSSGYTTGCIGKWDMSGRKFIDGQIPNDQGFDYYFGTLGANDPGYVYLMRNRDTLYRTEDMSSLTKSYTEEAISFLTKNKDHPFFLYLAHTMPHVMIDASPAFKGRSSGDLYGDVIEEMDFHVGLVLDKVAELGLDSNTYIIFLSDNGPWSGKEEYYRKLHGGKRATGSAFPLRGAKASSWEGGFRVPCIIRAPGMVPANRINNEMVSTLDLLPTVVKLAQSALPEGMVIDGIDQSALFTGITEKSNRGVFIYHQRGEIRAVRQGKWKLMLPFGSIIPSPELYDLENDISEQVNQADNYPEIMQSLFEIARKAPGIIPGKQPETAYRVLKHFKFEMNEVNHQDIHRDSNCCVIHTDFFTGPCDPYGHSECRWFIHSEIRVRERWGYGTMEFL